MKVRQRILASPTFKEFMKHVQTNLDRYLPDASQLQISLEKEKAGLQQQCEGWKLSLANPKLPSGVRATIEEDMDRTLARMTAIDSRVLELQSSASRSQSALDARAVAERLENLGEILSAENASATNLILAQHIAGIYCDSEGKVVVRLCKLGALGNPRDLGIAVPAEPNVDDASKPDAKPGGLRRRTRRCVASDFNEDDEISDAANDFAVDVSRFGGLGPEWFTEDIFHVPPQQSWAQEHAREVAEYRLTEHATMQETADYFDKSPPTIRAALKYALQQLDIDALGKKISAPTRAYWPRDNADAVAKFFSRPGATMKAAVIHFEKSQTWISKARKISREGTSHAPAPPTVTSMDEDQDKAA